MKIQRAPAKMTSHRPFPEDDFSIYHVLWASMYCAFLDNLRNGGQSLTPRSQGMRCIWEGSARFDSWKTPKGNIDVLPEQSVQGLCDLSEQKWKGPPCTSEHFSDRCNCEQRSWERPLYHGTPTLDSGHGKENRKGQRCWVALLR